MKVTWSWYPIVHKERREIEKQSLVFPTPRICHSERCMNEQVEVGEFTGMITHRTFPYVAVWIWRHDFQAKLISHVRHDVRISFLAMLVSELRAEKKDVNKALLNVLRL